MLASSWEIESEKFLLHIVSFSFSSLFHKLKEPELLEGSSSVRLQILLEYYFFLLTFYLSILLHYTLFYIQWFFHLVTLILPCGNL